MTTSTTPEFSDAADTAAASGTPSTVTDRPQTTEPPQWPKPGWAVQPRRGIGRPPRGNAPTLGSTAGIAVACVAVLAGLFLWGAYSVFAGQTSHGWSVVPRGQPYYVPYVRPDIPSSAVSTKLPPMLASAPSAAVTLKIDAPPLGGMYGGTGQVQDSYSPAYFAVPAGTPIRVTIVNYDPAWHTFTAPVLGLDVWIRPAGAHPFTTTFTFTAPGTGYFEWFCALPCDGYSMEGPGYMEGEIHVVRT